MNSKSLLVSIVLPNLNYFSFLEERTKSILNQTHSNWECIVIDGYSTDGSWDFFQETASKDPRFRIFQEPPKGIYDAWNKGINRVRGEFVHIATSDDTMQPDFLEKSIAALVACPSAGIAHCCLTLIDEKGEPLPQKEQWTQWKKINFYGDWISKYHVRKAPYDAILHSVYATVYTSVTQLLIRNSLFKEIGGFENSFGSISDFEWGLKASLNTDTVHIPHFLTSWRCHQNQSTDKDFKNKSEYFAQVIKMIDSAFHRNPKNSITKKDIQSYYFFCYIRKLRMENTTSIIKSWTTTFFVGMKLSPSLMINYILKKLNVIKKLPLKDFLYADYLLSKYPDARIVPIDAPKLL